MAPSQKLCVFELVILKATRLSAAHAQWPRDVCRTPIRSLSYARRKTARCGHSPELSNGNKRPLVAARQAPGESTQAGWEFLGIIVILLLGIVVGSIWTWMIVQCAGFSHQYLGSAVQVDRSLGLPL
jgi:hypothetical protein